METIIILHLIFFRGLVIGALSPVLQNTGYGFTWKEGTVMCWGGLRGAVGLALALQVAHHDTIDQEKVGLRVSIGDSVEVLRGAVCLVFTPQ